MRVGQSSKRSISDGWVLPFPHITTMKHEMMISIDVPDNWNRLYNSHRLKEQNALCLCKIVNQISYLWKYLLFRCWLEILWNAISIQIKVLIINQVLKCSIWIYHSVFHSRATLLKCPLKKFLNWIGACTVAGLDVRSIGDCIIPVSHRPPHGSPSDPSW